MKILRLHGITYSNVYILFSCMGNGIYGGQIISYSSLRHYHSSFHFPYLRAYSIQMSETYCTATNLTSFDIWEIYSCLVEFISRSVIKFFQLISRIINFNFWYSNIFTINAKTFKLTIFMIIKYFLACIVFCFSKLNY